MLTILNLNWNTMKNLSKICLAVSLLSTPLSAEPTEVSCYGDHNYKSASEKGCTIINGSLYIFESQEVESLKGLANLKKVKENFYVHDTNITNMDGLENLESVGWFFNIQGNTELESIANLRNLQTVGYELLLFDSDKLTNLNGLEGVIRLDGLRIAFNETLSDISALENLESIEYTVLVWDNPQLVDLSPLYGTNPRSIRIEGNASMSCKHEDNDSEFCRKF